MLRRLKGLFSSICGHEADLRAPVPADRAATFQPAFEELENRLVPSSLPLVVQGSQLVNAQTDQPVVLRGVNVGGLEGIGFNPDMVNNAVQAALNDWDANLIRLPVNQDYWLGDDPNVVDAATYQAEVDSVINAAAAKGAYVVLDLQVSDKGTSDPSQEGQYSMPDDNSTLFWSSAALKYANNPTVFFDPYNEPGHFNVTWDQWLNGGTITENDGSQFHSPGMQALVDTIRGTGANNIIVPQGLNYATDFSGILNGYALKDPDNNLMYQIHIYPGSAAHAFTDELNSLIPAGLTANYPVYVGEWGSDINPGEEGTPVPDASTWNTNMIQWLNQNTRSWTAWAMNDSPFLTNPGDLTPTPYFGALVKQELIQMNGGAPVNPAALSAVVQFADTSDWGTGFTGQISITNTGATAINGWTLEFDFAGTITDIWDAQIAGRQGNHYVIQNAAWDAVIAPGQTVTFGFNADWNNSLTPPDNYILNGVGINNM
jgi:hypothetical protein